MTECCIRFIHLPSPSNSIDYVFSGESRSLVKYTIICQRNRITTNRLNFLSCRLCTGYYFFLELIHTLFMDCMRRNVCFTWCWPNNNHIHNVAVEEYVTIMNVVVLLIQPMGNRQKMESILIISNYWIFIPYAQVYLLLFPCRGFSCPSFCIPLDKVTKVRELWKEIVLQYLRYR